MLLVWSFSPFWFYLWWRDLVFFLVSCVCSPVVPSHKGFFSFSNISFDELSVNSLLCTFDLIGLMTELAIVLHEPGIPSKHKLLPFVHTACQYYQLNVLVRYLNWALGGFILPCSSGRLPNLSV